MQNFIEHISCSYKPRSWPTRYLYCEPPSTSRPMPRL